MLTYASIYLEYKQEFNCWSHAVHCLAFWGTSRWFSSVAAIFHILTKSVWWFQIFFTSLTAIIIICPFHYVHPSKCEVVSHAFNLHFLMANNVKAYFHVVIGNFYTFYGKMSIQILCPFFSWIFWEIFAVKLYEVPYVFFILTLYQRLDLRGSSDGKESACNAEPRVWSLNREDPLEKGMAIHSSILAWRIP